MGSVDDLSKLASDSFDVVLCAHVLEHLPYEKFPVALAEIKRMAPNAIVYLPFACLCPEIKIGITPLFNKVLRLPFPLFWKSYKFNGQHYWEIGTKCHSRKKIRNEILKFFEIVNEYQNPDWHYSYNFVLRRALK